MHDVNIEYLGVNNGPIMAIVKNFYTQEEQFEMWKELDFLTYEGKLLSGEKTSSAKNQSGDVKHNHSIFLDHIYTQEFRFVSNILTTVRKTFDYNVLNTLENFNPIFRSIKLCNVDHTLLSYYQDGDSYFSHPDSTVFTILNYLHKEPKQFTGGELYFSDFDKTIEIENNMVIFMPGCYNHEVRTVHMDDKTPYSGDGRYCISQFLNMSGVVRSTV